MTTHRDMVLGRDGKWRPHKIIQRISDKCPMEPSGRHRFTSWRKTGDGPQVTICSWCAKPQG